MKKFFALMLAMAMALSLFGCGTNTTPTTEAPTQAAAQVATEAATEAAEPVELIVFAAASMTETLTTLGNQYMAENQNVNIIFNFDSSGTLKTQIQEGADCDIFISAGQKQMNQLDITADYEIENARTLSLLLNGAWNRVNDLERALSEAQGRNTHEMAFHYRDCVIVVMNVLRSLVDEMETLCDKKHWPYPCYGDLLFSVK